MKNISTIIVLVLLPVMLFSQSLQYAWQYYRPGNTGIQGDYATALWIDENGAPYIAANTGNWGEGGFARYNITDNTWTNYSNVDHEILGSFDNAEVQILDIVEDFNHTLWMGNFTGALKFNPQNGIGSATRYTAANSDLTGVTYDIDLAPDSSIWFTSGNLVRYNPNNNQWNSWQGSNTRLAVQPRPDGSYLVWSADTYYGYVFTYNSANGQYSSYLPATPGEIAGLPGKDCVDDAGNMWALRMAQPGDWETLEYQRPDGVWVNPVPPYQNVSYYIDAFKAYGNGKALLVTTVGETWLFDGTSWQNYGTWQQNAVTRSVDIDGQGNVWVCGTGGAARRDVQTGYWQRYRLTNTAQIEYLVEDIALDDSGNVWMTGNAGTGVGGFQKFDGSRWTGFNEYTYGLGYPFPFPADNTQAICRRPSNGDVVINPTFNGIHAWTGSGYYALENLLTSSKGFEEDSQGRLWSLGNYGGLRYFDDASFQWTDIPLSGWGLNIRKDPVMPGTVWASTDNEILRTNGLNEFRRTVSDFPGSADWFTGFAADSQGIAWVGTWSQFTSTGSTLIRINTVTGQYQTWEHDAGWPFPGEHVRPMAVTPDGLLWLQYDSEYPSTDAGICWFDGTNVYALPSAPGGLPQWGGLPNSNIRELEVRPFPGGYELWMSCKGRGIAVLTVYTEATGIPNQPSMETGCCFSVYPNPSAGQAKFEFENEENGKVQLALYDLKGRRVVDILDKVLAGGRQCIDWSGIGEDGTKVTSGIYFARLSTRSKVITIKLILK